MKQRSNPAETYFLAKQMENAGLLRPGQAVQLVTLLAAVKKPKQPSKGKPKRGTK